MKRDNNIGAILQPVIAASLLLGFDRFPGAAQPIVSNIKPDEEIVFFPAIAWSSPDGQWHLPIQGCVSEPEPRRIALALLRTSLHISHVEVSSAEEATLAERGRLFMVDHERGKRVVVQLGSQRFALDKSGPDGWFRGEVVLSGEQVQELSPATSNGPPAIAFHACLREDDPRLFAGKAVLVGTEGLVVVSDIDDTIKISNVADRSALLRSTFLEQFKPVPGVPELYRSWAARGDCHFCYVSASPWPLFIPLSQFISSEGFPEGTFQLRQFRLKDRSALSLFEGPEKHKLATIDPLFAKFPRRGFILVGDSGEQDPEIYGTLARKYPRQIVGIFIREVGSSRDDKRYATAFRGLDSSLWTSFRDPAALSGTLDRVKNTLKSTATGAN